MQGKVDYTAAWGNFGGDRNALYLDCESRYIIIFICQANQTMQQKFIHVIVCKLFHTKTDQKYILQFLRNCSVIDSMMYFCLLMSNVCHLLRR